MGMLRKRKGRRPSKKCASYIRRMITKGSWKCDQQIPPLCRIASTLNISQATVRKVLSGFERDGSIENHGSMGFYLVSPGKRKLRKSSKNMYLLGSLKSQLSAVELLQQGGKSYKNWVIKFDKDERVVSGLNMVSGVLYQCSLKELTDMLLSQVTLDDVLRCSNNEFSEKKKLYKRQQSLSPLAYLVSLHKQELGINE